MMSAIEKSAQISTTISKSFWVYRERRLASNNSMKHLYTYLNSKMKCGSTLPSLVDDNGCWYHTDAGKASALGNFFARTFNSQSFPSAEPLSCGLPAQHTLCDIYFNSFNIYKLLRRLKPSVTEPYDGIPPIIYADDIKLYGVYDCSNRDSVLTSLKLAIEKLNTWASDLDLAMNLNKCYVLHIGDEAPNIYDIEASRLIACTKH
ncbi:hypothetical protein COOONC_17347 [Cooperia oncophora]